MSYYETSFIVHAPLDKVWAFHDDPIGLTQIMPFPLKVVLRQVDRPVQAGSRILMTWWFGPLPVKWNITVREKVAPAYFTDVQPAGEGPFAQWEHTHAFEPAPNGTRITERIHYEFPFGAFGKFVDRLMGPLIFKAMFAPRAAITRRYLEQ